MVHKKYKTGLMIRDVGNKNGEDGNLVDIFESEWFSDIDSKTSVLLVRVPQPPAAMLPV